MRQSLNPRPRIIFFDAAGTLFHLPRGVGEHYRDVALRHGIDRPAQELEVAFRTAWRASVPPPTTRQPRVDDDKDWWRELVGVVFPGAESRRPALFEDLYQEFTRPGVWELYPEVPKVLNALARTCRLGIISNFDKRLRVVLRQLGIEDHFDPIVISSEVGADKPDPYIYSHAADLAGVAPADAWHVGDDPDCDWRGAREAGMTSLELSRPQNTLATVLGSLIQQ